MKTVLEIKKAGFEIKIEQYEKGAKGFRVTYGNQVKDHLSYADAAKELGESIFHALACEGKLDLR